MRLSGLNSFLKPLLVFPARLYVLEISRQDSTSFMSTNLTLEDSNTNSTTRFQRSGSIEDESIDDVGVVNDLGGGTLNQPWTIAMRFLDKIIAIEYPYNRWSWRILI
jgi:hypothetical protein